jgi:cysteine-rich repeat protein
MTVQAWCRRVAIVLVACLAWASPASAVIELVGVTSARFEWTPSEGPVWFYEVYVARNGDSARFHALRGANMPWTEVSAEYGDEIQVSVLAISVNDERSPLSEPSELVRFVEAAPAPAPACGDGNVDPGEACDDGNTSSGDGCSAACTIEPEPEPDIGPTGAPSAPLDFDGDGQTDLVFRHADTGELLLWYVDADRAQDAGPALGALLAGQELVGDADYDSNGFADLLVADAAAGELELRSWKTAR